MFGYSWFSRRYGTDDVTLTESITVTEERLELRERPKRVQLKFKIKY